MVNHLITIRTLTKEQLTRLVLMAQHIKDHPDQYANLLEGRYVSNLFFEPSTRTRFSFEMAQHRLGLKMLHVEEATSSRQKGETLYDTLKTLEAIGVNAAVIRHAENGILDQIKDRLSLPLISAGIGNEEHPTQCLLDLLTIYQEFKRFEELKVAIVGDVRHSRVARSAYDGLTKLGAQVYFAGPAHMGWHGGSWMPQEAWQEWDELLEEMDVVMLLRIQHERHQEKLNMSKHEYHLRYGLTEERAKRMKRGAIIMHPGPVNRDVEIASELVESPSSRIFKQMENGVYVRMAVLLYALGADKEEMTGNKEGGERNGYTAEERLYV